MQVTDKERQTIVEKSCPGPGACGGMYTANTMATAIEALGMSLPYSSSMPADSKEKKAECYAAGKAIRVIFLSLKQSDFPFSKAKRISSYPPLRLSRSPPPPDPP